MLYGYIQISNRLEISKTTDKDQYKAYVSQVEDFITETELIVHVPVSYGQYIKLLANELYSMLFFTDKGMIRFEAEILKYVKDNDFQLMHILLKSPGERIQKREFFRFNCLIPLRFTSFDDFSVNEADESGKGVIYDGIIKDIGGGGIRFVTNKEIDETLTIKNIIMLNDECLALKGKVLHKQFFPKSNYKYQYRIEFFEIDQSEREKIIRYIFNEQRKIMQRTR